MKIEKKLKKVRKKLFKLQVAEKVEYLTFLSENRFILPYEQEILEERKNASRELNISLLKQREQELIKQIEEIN